MTTERAARPIAVITVHGTGDTADGLDGPKWFQRGSAFTEALKQEVAQAGVIADIFPLLWSGANSAMQREAASKALTREIRQLASTHCGVHIIGHSHGGNVANDAACMLSWSMRRRRPKVDTITTVGTPFFRTRVTWAEQASAWALLTVMVLSACIYTTAFLFLWKSTDINYWIALAVFVLTLLLVTPLAVAGVLRARRARRKHSKDAKILAIWHPNDEAIALLQHIEKMRLEPFPQWSLLRGSRTGGALWATLAALAAPIIAWPFYSPVTPLHDINQRIGHFTAQLGLVLLWAPAAYIAIYLLYRASVTLVLELMCRDAMNGAVGGTLKGIAFGRDGDHRVCEVSPRSHYFETQETVLDGEVAERMREASAQATRRLFDKYRNGLFSVSAETSNAVAELAADAMTWDSLIHTTYFDQPELALTIARRVSASVHD